MSGLFGVVSQGDCMQTLLYGTDYHSHLGTQFGGIAVLGDHFTRRIHNISQSQFKSKFYEDNQEIKGNMGIGVISSFDEQPIYLKSRLGEFCLVAEGFIENTETLAQALLKKGISFTEMSRGSVNTTELIAKMISQGDTIIDGIEKVYDVLEGSCSMLLLHRDGIYAARDRKGYTPLVLGRRKDGFAVASETSAFPNNGYQITHYLKPGEIVLMTQKGLVTKIQGLAENQICSFLWIYTGFPASDYEGINTEITRERCGRFLARRDKNLEIDFVAGVPDSGTTHAIGYAMESKKPFRRPLVKYTPGYGRSYTPPSQEVRDLIATMKLIAIKEVIQGNRLVLCEDSIVRGTQLKNFTVNKLWGAGAKEIHVRPACPPLLFPCKFCLSTRSIDELAARKAIRDIEGKDIEDVTEYLDPENEKYQRMVDWITRDLDVTSIRYQILEDMVEAIGLPRENLCLYCWTGECPQKKNKNQKEIFSKTSSCVS